MTGGLAVWLSPGIQATMLLHRVEVHLIGLPAELFWPQFVFDLEDRLAGIDERHQLAALLKPEGLFPGYSHQPRTGSQG